MGKKNLRIVIALFPEAKSLIKLYKLNEYNSAEKIFKIYCNKNSNIWLVISGIGNVNCASATTYLYLKSPIINKNIWINFGMGGSNSLKIGEIYNIKKVTYKTRDKLESFYTSAIINSGLPIMNIFSVDSIEKKFKIKNTIYEMEAYGFMKTVERFCERELICIIKIISDNKFQSATNFVRKINSYIKPNLEKISDEIDNYVEISKNIINKKKIDTTIVENKFHLTFNNKIIIKDLAEKIILAYSKKKLENLLIESKSLDEFIKKMRHNIKNYKFNI